MPTPPSPQNHRITLGDLTFQVATWGRHGPNLVLLHGLASTRKIWDLVAPLLAPYTSIITLDQRGHGDSDKPAVGYDFATISHDLHLALETLSVPRPIIVGHSWGGNVAVEFASAYPDEVAGIALIDGGLIQISTLPGNSLEKALVQMAPPVFDNLSETALRRKLSSRTWPHRDQTSLGASLEDIIIANFTIKQDDTITARLSLENHLKIIKALWDHHPMELLPTIDCPVLLMPARSSQELNPSPDLAQISRKEATILAAEKVLKTHHTTWLEDSIHDVPLQKPELVASVLLHHIEHGIFRSH